MSESTASRSRGYVSKAADTLGGEAANNSRIRPGGFISPAGGPPVRSESGPPPVQGGSGGSRPPTGNAPTGEDDEYDDLELLGRGYNYDQEDMELLASKMRLVSSSNVYGYAYQQETPSMGIMYVTYLDWIPAVFGGTGERSGAGPTYAYYDVPIAKFRAFEAMAASSAGGGCLGLLAGSTFGL